MTVIWETGADLPALKPGISGQKWTRFVQLGAGRGGLQSGIRQLRTFTFSSGLALQGDCFQLHEIAYRQSYAASSSSSCPRTPAAALRLWRACCTW